MRSMRITAVGGLLFAAATVYSQSPAVYETVVTADTEARSGPSPVYYATQKLPRGTPIRVVGEKDGGWLAIEPPQGSFSWINGRLLGENNGRSAVVLAPDAPVLAGSSLLDRQPDVVSTKLPRGSQVVILGEPKVLTDGSKWWPILPQKEARYLPREVVAAKSAVEAISKSPITPPSFNPGAAVPTDPLWLQAEQAREAGKAPEARQLYEACLRQPNLDDSTRWRCLERLQGIGAGTQVAAQPNHQPPAPPVPPAPPSPVGDFRSPTGVPVAGAAGSGVGTSGVLPAPSPTPIPNAQGQAVGYGPRPAEAVGGQTAGPGHLRRAGFFIDGKQAYALEDSQGQLLMYATSQGSLSLDSFIGRNVSLAGTIAYHQQLRKDYILATQVMPLP
jgi:hypothetical protein